MQRVRCPPPQRPLPPLPAHRLAGCSAAQPSPANAAAAKLGGAPPLLLLPPPLLLLLLLLLLLQRRRTSHGPRWCAHTSWRPAAAAAEAAVAGRRGAVPHVHEVVRPHLLEAGRQLAEEVAGHRFGRAAVGPQVMGQVTTGAELHHQIELVPLLDQGSAEERRGGEGRPRGVGGAGGGGGGGAG